MAATAGAQKRRGRSESNPDAGAHLDDGCQQPALGAGDIAFPLDGRENEATPEMSKRADPISFSFGGKQLSLRGGPGTPASSGEHSGSFPNGSRHEGIMGGALPPLAPSRSHHPHHPLPPSALARTSSLSHSTSIRSKHGSPGESEFVYQNCTPQCPGKV